MSTVAEQPLPTGRRGPWAAMFAVCFTQAVVLLDTTAVNVAVPSVAHGLHAGMDQVLWMINAYLLAYAVLLATGGRLGDLFGPRRIFLIGLAVFVLASAACGAAQTPEQAIIARVFQGVGGALQTPQAMAIITRMFPADRRGAALGVWGSFAGIVAAAGPTLGGLMVSWLGWRGIFYLNLPVGLIGSVLVVLLVPRLASARRRRIDLLGSAVLTVGMLGVVYGLIEGPPHHWGALLGPLTTPVVIAAGVLLLGVFLLVERGRQERDPLVPFTILRNRNFTVMAVVVSVLPCGLGGVLLLTPLYLQEVQKFSAFRAGLLIAAAPLVSIFVAPYSGKLCDRFGGKYVMVAGLLLFGTGIGLLAGLIRTQSGWAALLPGLFFVGLGMGVAFAPAGVVAFARIPPEMSGAASGVFNTTRLCGSLLGSASVAALLQAQLSHGGVTHAVRVTYLLPVAVLAAGALVTLLVRPDPVEEPAPPTVDEVSEPTGSRA
ncbi:MFS transporter [Kitasatospora kifunensis]|uniref:EmrB/QacA subfamily drug resistance transporter n=1 Tax=Kitasatospora kifunensis TaxID=58351 RepID=A0A7W7QXY9_KITKI|nr:MFS transporter [Kitasatospora kifunensis]MBB4921191.1 EmrB/QacA subfamily drug resistance transporter [Kitasatospora kifunensis]